MNNLINYNDFINEQLWHYIPVILGSVPLFTFLIIFASRGLITRKLYKRLIRKANNVNIQVRELTLHNAFALINQADLVPFFTGRNAVEVDNGPFYYIRISDEERQINDVDPYGEEEWGEDATEIIISQTTRKMLVKNIPMDDYPKIPIASKRIIRLSRGEYNKIVEKIAPLLHG